MNAKAFTRVKPTSIASIAVLIALLVLSSQVPIIGAVPPAAALLDPKTIPKYVNHFRQQCGATGDSQEAAVFGMLRDQLSKQQGVKRSM